MDLSFRVTLLTTPFPGCVPPARFSISMGIKSLRFVMMEVMRDEASMRDASALRGEPVASDSEIAAPVFELCCMRLGLCGEDPIRA